MKVSVENMGRAFGGAQLSARFADMISLEKTEETRTEEEIIAHVRSRGWGGKNDGSI